MDRVLILGGSGLVGAAVFKEMLRSTNYLPYITYHTRQPELRKDLSFKSDIDDMDRLYSILTQIKPHSVISCLRGDFDKQLLFHVKAAEYLRDNGGSLYFFSTTNVFDNDLSRPHYEDDIPNSQTDYGQYKIECENRIAKILGDRACILRLPQVWGKESPRMKLLINALVESKKITVYPKLFHNTNTDVMIAKQLCYIMGNSLKGIFHLVSEDVINYRDFYHQLMLSLGFDNGCFEDNYEEEGYFALLSRRCSEFPEQLRFTNHDVIKYLSYKSQDLNNMQN